MNTSFSRFVKDELARSPLPDGRAEVAAELTAFLYTSGSVHIGGGGRGLHFVSTHSPTVRRLFSLWQRGYGIRPVVIVCRGAALNGRVSFRAAVSLDGRTEEALREMDVWHEGRVRLEPGGARLGSDPQVQKAYLRGSFLGGGSISDPKSGYHMEIRCHSRGNARLLCETLARLGIRAHLTDGGDGPLVYVKDAESTADFLRAVGAPGALFRLEDVRIVKDLRNRINRLVNSETANMTKSIRASLDQLRDIERLDPELRAGLSARTRELVELRVNHPHASLRELGDMMRPPVSKSTVEYHFRKIRSLVSARG
ncbi:MAG: DNA-binding protein WhiA [Bacillota bacterium]